MNLSPRRVKLSEILSHRDLACMILITISGLIIDAFGELRDQLEQVKEDMESKCFICGIGKEYFDKVPHGFETHTEKEHNFANYM